MKIDVIRGDITVFSGDAIVNAANKTLLGGGGVDGAIHHAGGPQILEECKAIIAKIGSCATGEAVITSAGNMPSNYVIHTVGPIWAGGKHNEAQQLANCYTNALKLAVENNIRSIAFPNISTGVYGFPKKEAAEISVRTVRQFRAQNTTIEKVVFVCFDDENFQLVSQALENSQL